MKAEFSAPGTGFLFMKVGTHANEDLSDIINRKRAEIDEAGFALWGYGGNTCHPLTMVQPFARDFVERDGTIFLCMQPMTSNHFAESARAEEYSSDGTTWQEVPDAINVLGSRFALKIESLDEHEQEIPLSHTKVAVGPSQGRRGDLYVSGRVDKACLEVVEDLEIPTPEDDKVVEIGLTAKLADPYAVFLRGGSR